MKKILPVIVGILFLGAGAIIFLAKPADKKNATTPNASPTVAQTETKPFSPPKACDVLTIENARKILGDNAEKTELPGGGTASSEDIEVSQCAYTQPGSNTLESIRNQKQASILVRGAKTQKGADSNKEVFTGSLKPANVQDASGYGDAAFWNPEFGQFNILKNGNWYILSAGVSRPGEKSVDEAKTLADLLISKL